MILIQFFITILFLSTYLLSIIIKTGGFLSSSMSKAKWCCLLHFLHGTTFLKSYLVHGQVDFIQFKVWPLEVIFLKFQNQNLPYWSYPKQKNTLWYVSVARRYGIDLAKFLLILYTVKMYTYDKLRLHVFISHTKFPFSLRLRYCFKVFCEQQRLTFLWYLQRNTLFIIIYKVFRHHRIL